MVNKNIEEKTIKGVYEITIYPHEDSRGSFLNIFRKNNQIFKSGWEDRTISQINISKTTKKGTIRGLHYQASPHSECKIIRCIKGLVFDVVVDLRKESLTYGHWISINLSNTNNKAILIPEGCAHGFQVLQENSELIYIHSGNWEPISETGIRWNDPTINIKWPLPIEEISKRDQELPFLKMK